MKCDSKKIAKVVLALSIIVIITGYFLWTILIPIQDFHLMSDAQVLDAQQEYALNYPLGRFLLNIGFISFVSSIAYLAKGKIKSVINKLIHQKSNN